MAKMNLLAKQGIKPKYDVYKVPVKEVEEIFQKIIKDRFHIDVKIAMDRDEEDSQLMRTSILGIEQIPMDIYDDMMTQNFDPEDDDTVQQQLLFYLGGGQDTGMTWGGTINNTTHYVEIYINPRQDIELELLEVMEIAQNDSREDTVIALNQLLKKVRVE